MRTGFLLGLVTLGSVLFIGCSAAQAPSSTLSSEPDASVAFGPRYRALVSLPGVDTARVWEPEPANVYFWER